MEQLGQASSDSPVANQFSVFVRESIIVALNGNCPDKAGDRYGVIDPVPPVGSLFRHGRARQHPQHLDGNDAMSLAKGEKMGKEWGDGG